MADKKNNEITRKSLDPYLLLFGFILAQQWVALLSRAALTREHFCCRNAAAGVLIVGVVTALAAATS